MSEHEHTSGVRPHCCPCGSHDHSAADSKSEGDISRRGFMGGMSVAALGGVALSGLTWSKLAAAGPELDSAPQRRPLVVKPVFIYQTYKPVPQLRPPGMAVMQERFGGRLPSWTSILGRAASRSFSP